ncbi:MAG: hypothetical protein PHU92_03650, partial [Candidatus Shapirobacteria bacterium]|nr:hypothetical protein [Candidatus Shapirobacteria bacterium]
SSDVCSSDLLNSVRTLNADELFKIIKRFSEIPHLFEACTRIYRELGINNEALAEVRKRIEDPRIKKSRGMITSEIVEDMLDERKREYEEWLRGAGNSQRAVAEVRFI